MNGYSRFDNVDQQPGPVFSKARFSGRGIAFIDNRYVRHVEHWYSELVVLAGEGVDQYLVPGGLESGNGGPGLMDIVLIDRR